ncbi:MAG TPA: extracellular solute-binding protein [Cytophagaceae bacterium]|jgi:multiple sugar transport system substrate-binding protein
MSEKRVLKGITWGHSRGITPLLAGSQRFNELHPDVEIVWKKRTLQEFADFPIEKLVNEYDLLIIDHPWVGTAAATSCVLPLNEHIDPTYLKDQELNSTGYSCQSYNYAGNQWALAIDAATPVASFRADLLERNGVKVPDTWEEVLELAESGRVAVPGIPVDLLMNFYMFCLALGEEPFRTQEEVVSEGKGVEALQTMKQLWILCDKEIFNFNPIAVAEAMTSTDKYFYCPFAYGYANYSRVGYAKHLLHYSDLVRFKQHGRLKSTLGGTGLAISASTAYKEECLRFAVWINSPEVQQGLYTEYGGQPGHRSAWTNPRLNLISNNYFQNTLPALDRAYVRPRYHGYLHFQDLAGAPVRDYLMGRGTEESALAQINQIYKDSLMISNGSKETTHG